MSLCIQLVVVAVTLLLSDVTCQTVHNINVSDNIHFRSDCSKALQLSQQNISSIVDRHNILRSLEGAANMELMVWSRDEASQAATLAAGCRAVHNRGGQNLCDMRGDDLTNCIDRWYNEKAYYNFENNTWVKATGHYTQVVWAGSRHAGCAAHRCAWTFVVYKPAGNLRPKHGKRLRPSKDRRVRSAPMELDGARTNCATRSVHVLE